MSSPQEALTLDPVLPKPGATELLFECHDGVKVTVQVGDAHSDGTGQHLREKLEGNGDGEMAILVLATAEGLFLQAAATLFIPYSTIVLCSVGKGKVYCQVEVSEYKPSPTHEPLPVTVASGAEDESDPPTSIAEDEPLLVEIYLDFVQPATAQQLYNLLSSQASTSHDDFASSEEISH